MLRVFRHCIGALLAVTLSAQIIEAQAFACDRMEMVAGSAMGNVHGTDSHQMNSPGSSGPSRVAQEDGSSTAASDCDLEASCLNGSAVPSLVSPRGHAYEVTAALADDTSSVSSRTLSPDLPPPRL